MTYNIVNIGTANNSPIQQAGAHSTPNQVITYNPPQLADLNRLVNEFATHLNELDIDPLQRRKAEAQIATIQAQLKDEPDPMIVKQAGRTLRSITEGAVGSLIATASQPTVWHWIHQAMASLFP